MKTRVAISKTRAKKLDIALCNLLTDMLLPYGVENGPNDSIRLPAIFLARIFHESAESGPQNWEPACRTERSAESANNMAVLPSVLGCRLLQRTTQLRLETNTLWLPGARPPRQNPPQADDSGQARLSSWSRDSNS